ncbi:LuxR family transcriptional regulator [Trebonia kvetii]|uniref:LuxR family transcriptional regulator n=1 Tax=Trebonia kvetii TaxID=2480626 RepID=A0A6P2C522_9ACTN|nr:LuxR family transcriptional regulator [Trebonia kvetii]TVZ06529.1 LuxR family transcriptional regulator [Trebonia kvetii]
MPFNTARVLLERERELETLREGLDGARAGEGTLLLIEGPAGMGKTALARAGRAAAGQAGMMPLEARASELEQPFAFGVVRQLLEPVVNQDSGHADLFAGAAGPATRLFEPDERRPLGANVGFEALHSLYWLVVNITDQAPVLVLVDDCQWVDRESLRFLDYLAQRIEGLPVAMLLTGRSPDAAAEKTESLWAHMASRPSAVALYPRPLSQSAAVALARERMGAEAAEEFCRACHTATGGNPLFLRELLRALDAAGVVPSAAAADEVQAVGPAAVSRFVLHRLATLGPAATELARAVAVMGDDSELPLAGRLAGLSEDVAGEAADDLVRADIFVHAERLGFVHPIVRAALYEDLAPGERQARHAAAAEALAAEGAPAERVTAHLLLTTPTGDQRRVATLRSAAADAAHRGGMRAAAEYLRRALAESPAAQERAETLAELGRCEVAIMQFEAAEEHLRTALTLDAALTTRAVAAFWLGRCAIVSGGRSARAAADALASLAGELQTADPERSLELGSELLSVTTAFTQLRGGLAVQLQRFRDQARGHPGFEAVARIHSAYEQILRGEPATAAMEEVEQALATGLPRSAQSNAALLALLALRLGERYELAVQLVDAALVRARQEGHATRQGILHAQRAAITLAQGSLHDAQAEADTGLLLVEESHFVVPLLVAVAITVQVERGELDAADRLAQTGEAFGIANRAHISDFLTARGRLRIAQGRLEEGVADLLWCGERREARGQCWPSDWRAHAAPAVAALGERQLAVKLAREQLAAARRVGAPGALGMSLRTAALAIGEDERLALLREAVSVLERSSARLELAHALADLAAELSRAGGRREGRDAARRAAKLAGQCGATAMAESAMAELHAGPGRRARMELTGPDALTAAEWRVCRQAAEGRTNREVAQALFLTEKTIERHLSSAYTKLGIRSRFQLPAAIGE